MYFYLSSQTSQTNLFWYFVGLREITLKYVLIFSNLAASTIDKKLNIGIILASSTSSKDFDNQKESVNSIITKFTKPKQTQQQQFSVIYNTVTHSLFDSQQTTSRRSKFIDTIKRLPYQDDDDNDDVIDLSSAVKKVGDIFFNQQQQQQQNNQLIDGNVLVIYITGPKLEQEMQSEALTTLLKQYTTDKGLELVFVVSGRLGSGTRDMVQKLAGSPHRLIFMNNNDDDGDDDDDDDSDDKSGESDNVNKNIDSILPNVIMLEGKRCV